MPWAVGERLAALGARVAGDDLGRRRRGCRAAARRSSPRPSRRSRRSRSCGSRGGTSRRRIAPGLAAPALDGRRRSGLSRPRPRRAGRSARSSVRSSPRKPARRSDASTTPGSCHVHGIAVRRAAGRVGQQLDRAPGGRRAGGARAATPWRVSSPAPRTRPSRNAASTASAPGSPGRGGTTHGSATWRCARRRWATQPVARAIERGAVGVRGVELALVGDQRREEPDARGRLLDPAGERLVVEPARDDVELGLPRRVVEGAARELAAAQEPVVGEGRRRRCRQRRRARRGGGPGGCRLCRRRRPSRRSRRSPVVDRRRRRARRRRARLDRGAQPDAQERVRARLAEAGRAQLRPALEVVRRRASSRACRTTGSRRWRGTATRAWTAGTRQSTRAQVSGGDMPSNAAGSISSASTSMPSMTRGPGRENSPDPSTANTRPSCDRAQLRPAVGPRRARPLGDRRRRARTRRASARGSPGRPRASAAHVVSTRPAALLRRAAPSRRRAAPAPGPSGRRRTAGRATRSRRRAAGRTRGRAARRRSPRPPAAARAGPRRRRRPRPRPRSSRPTVWIELRIPSIEAGSRLITVTSPSSRRATSLTSR